jgi:hypothetical protein
MTKFMCGGEPLPGPLRTYIYRDDSSFCVCPQSVPHSPSTCRRRWWRGSIGQWLRCRCSYFEKNKQEAQVVSFNGVLASQAVSEVLQLLTGYRGSGIREADLKVPGESVFRGYKKFDGVTGTLQGVGRGPAIRGASTVNML